MSDRLVKFPPSWEICCHHWCGERNKGLRGTKYRSRPITQCEERLGSSNFPCEFTVSCSLRQKGNGWKRPRRRLGTGSREKTTRWTTVKSRLILDDEQLNRVVNRDAGPS